MEVSWIGAGIMGARMVRHLIEAGHSVRVFDLDSKATKELSLLGASVSKSPAQAAKGTDVVFIMVAFPDQLREVMFSSKENVADVLTPGMLVVNCTTSSPSLDIEIGEVLREKQAEYLDAPVSGGPAGAENANLSFMVGGSQEAFDRALPLLKLMGKEIVLQGSLGRGQYTKIVNQILIAGNIIAASEAYMFATSAGLDPATVLKSVAKGAAASFMLDFVWPRAMAEDMSPGFRVEHFIKDLRIALEEAERLDLCLPGLALAKQLYQAVINTAGHNLGTQALVKMYTSINSNKGSNNIKEVR